MNSPPTELTPDDRKTLRTWKFGQKVEYRLWVRASIIWGLWHHRSSVTEVAKRSGVTVWTVRKWRQRFLEEGIAGLYDRATLGTAALFQPGAAL